MDRTMSDLDIHTSSASDSAFFIIDFLSALGLKSVDDEDAISGDDVLDFVFRHEVSGK